MRTKAFLFATVLPLAAGATEPMSVIEWLGENPPDHAGPVLLEPPVSKSARQPEIDVLPLEETALPVGLVPSTVTGLPITLWSGSDPETLTRLIRDVPVRGSPAMQKLLYTLLLSETVPPAPDTQKQSVLLARIDRLFELGATDPAQALTEVAGPTNGSDLFRRWFDATLLTGFEEKSCAVLIKIPHLAPDYAARIFCTARAGDWQTAALTLEAAHALELLPPHRLDLLDRFLSPDIFDGAPPLPVPDDPDPLTFRLFETIGEALPTSPLPRAFATADLRDIAGWKAQLEAAERLTRIGALSPNILLGLYTDRRASASGGVWDRVRAMQKFETALQSHDADAVARTLPPVWTAMRQADLEVPFSSLFADALSDITLDDPKQQDLVLHIRLLAGDAGGSNPIQVDQQHPFVAALAQGDFANVVAPDAMAQAIADGFVADVKPTAPPTGMGEAILRAMMAYDKGRRGNPADLSEALKSLRSYGLEDTARQAALQLLLLEQS